MAAKRSRSRSNPKDRYTLPVRAYELQNREECLLDLLRSYPNHVIRGLAERPEAEWHFGRLYLVGAISRSQYEAADYLDRVTRTYERMLRQYGHLRASNAEKTEGKALEDLSKSAQKKFKRARKRYEDVYNTLTQCGNDVHKAVVDALRKDAKTDLDLIRRGLGVLSIGVGLERENIRLKKGELTKWSQIED